MNKLLKHNTALEPIYIALSPDLRFHVLYGETSMGSYDSVGAAIQFIADERIYGVSNMREDWECLALVTRSTNAA